MHYYIFASKDSYITEDSPGHIVLYPDSTDKNYGGDEILELKKGFVNSYSTASYNVSRILTEFDYTTGLIPQFQVNGGLIPSESAKYYLRYYEVEGQQELDKTYSLSSHVIGASGDLNKWVEGSGKHFDNPKTKTGVTWTDYDSGSAWYTGAGSAYLSGSRTPGGGVWLDSATLGTNLDASQSFVNQSGDIEMDVTDIVNKHLDGTFYNTGILTKFSGSYEDDGTPLHLKFFSRNTHTIYTPKLEVRWDDSTHSPGTLTQLTMSGEIENHIFIKGLQPTYRESEKVRFRMGCRKKYVQKTFTESALTSSFYVPHGSGSYSIVDVATNTPIVPFGAYTSMSCDSNSMYFDQWLNTFEPGRYYKVLFKLKYEDGQEVIIDNDEEFKVI